MVNNDLVYEEARAAADLERQAVNAVRAVEFTYVQKVVGHGYAHFEVAFDCGFTTEPIFTSGATLYDHPDGMIPHSFVYVTGWQMDAKRQTYLGASLTLVCSYWMYSGVGAPPRPTHVAQGSDLVAAQMTFFLTFKGMGRHRTKQEVDTAAQFLKDAKTGVGNY